MIRRPPRSTLFPTRRSSDLLQSGLEQRFPGVSSTPCTFGSRPGQDRKSTRLNSSHLGISYAVFCLKKKNKLLGRNAYSQYPKLLICSLTVICDYRYVASSSW